MNQRARVCAPGTQLMRRAARVPSVLVEHIAKVRVLLVILLCACNRSSWQRLFTYRTPNLCHANVRPLDASYLLPTVYAQPHRVHRTNLLSVYHLSRAHWRC